MSNTYPVLVMCDVQNVFYGGKNFSSRRGTTNFGAIKEYLTDLIQQDYAEEGEIVDVEAWAYGIQTDQHDNIDLFADIREAGFFLVTEKDSVASKMQIEVLDKVPEFSAVVVISGSGIFQKVFKAVARNWPDIIRIIAAFDGTLHGVYRGGDDACVDEVIILDDRHITLGSGDGENIENKKVPGAG